MTHSTKVAGRAEPLVTVDDLRVTFIGDRYAAVDGVTFTLSAGRCTALLGASGSGKTVTARALTGLLDPQTTITEGVIIYDGRDLITLGSRERRQLRGRDFGMVFQDPQAALNPVVPVGLQIAEVLRVHHQLARREAAGRAIELLDRMRVPQARERARARPFELSGGMCQRAMIAMAVATRPPVVVADEPTTALDRVTQAEVLDLFDELRAEGTALLLITHDRDVVERLADEVAVVDRGRTVEHGDVADVLARPSTTVAAHLMQPLPNRPAISVIGGGELVLEVRELSVVFERRAGFGVARQRIRAVDAVDLDVHAGETLAVVGPSGAGKSSLSRAVTRLVEPASGVVRVDGIDLLALRAANLRRHRARIQLVSQDVMGSLDPRRTVAELLTEPWKIHPDSRPAGSTNDALAGLLDAVGLPKELALRRPGACSAGQRQRVAIARALAVQPRILVLDEPVASLDRPVRSAILALLRDLQQRRGTAIILITHDMNVARSVSHRIAVLDHGRVVETGPTEAVLREPVHATTIRMLHAVGSGRTERGGGAAR